MKMKSFAMLAITGLLAASFSYIAPAMADDDMNADIQSAQPADNAGNMVVSDNSNTNNSGADNTAASGSGSNMDQGTPDTATGDDDY